MGLHDFAVIPFNVPLIFILKSISFSVCFLNCYNMFSVPWCSFTCNRHIKQLVHTHTLIQNGAHAPRDQALRQKSQGWADRYRSPWPMLTILNIARQSPVNENMKTKSEWTYRKYQPCQIKPDHHVGPPQLRSREMRRVFTQTPSLSVLPSAFSHPS